MQLEPPAPLVAIACGGTGGHLFPGLAVAEELKARRCDITLLVSPKEVDRQAARSAVGMEVVPLPVVALSRGRLVRFIHGFWNSYRAAYRLFAKRPPQAVLAMGGFTAAPPILAGKKFGTATFLHESNFIPGRANRWLAHWVNQAFVGFPETEGFLLNPKVITTGTPVRSQFQPRDPGACRVALGLNPERPVLLVMGGSQGASGINDLVRSTLPIFAEQAPELQFIHLTGPNDFDKVQSAYFTQKRDALVHPFLTEMELALGAATVAISRAGASSLAEIAAIRVPAILIPFPAAVDNHQFFNARAFDRSGAARLVEQHEGTPERLANTVVTLAQDASAREAMQTALDRWHAPEAAQKIADEMLKTIRHRQPVNVIQTASGNRKQTRLPSDGLAQMTEMVPRRKTRGAVFGLGI
ncbi:MAG: undecaprenyldiphospho-muramoylpentapeptide beta-N-acetylglucosaminyltransferase [Verrucomicrobia bacterium]|nr:MAG: undecaprenyldiphospho-muramoylpentapeptide beta-N-acetylglucosaminyltransferase [Verrucomicrobiota bacterium]